MPRTDVAKTPERFCFTTCRKAPLKDTHHRTNPPESKTPLAAEGKGPPVVYRL